jgi:hypothetical protein
VSPCAAALLLSCQQLGNGRVAKRTLQADNQIAPCRPVRDELLIGGSRTRIPSRFRRMLALAVMLAHKSLPRSLPIDLATAKVQHGTHATRSA